MADAKKDEPKKDDKKADGQPAEGAPKKNKLPMMLGGGAVAMIALGWIFATMAVPKKDHEEKPHLEGPYVARLSKTEIQVNLAGEGSKRYLVMMLNGEYTAYDEAYVNGRLGIAGAGGGHGGDAPAEDPLYTIQLKNAVLSLASTRTREQVTDPVQIESFLEEARRLVEPVLFPVYIGDSHSPHHADSKSGLKLGESMHESEMRGLLHDHEIDVDSIKKRLRFDEGQSVDFEGRERDLELVNEHGDKVWLDVSELKDDFTGKVAIGVPGRLRKIYRESFLVQ
ncbi:MAG: hypothetical protein HZA53_05655 [Planctomycetes bacterium]|nr:hypothetical protein [Planctomycetota bacterium]